MGVIAWIVLGLIAGSIAKAIMPGKDPGGIVVTALIGIVGALVGGYIGNLITGHRTHGIFPVEHPSRDRRIADSALDLSRGDALARQHDAADVVPVRGSGRAPARGSGPMTTWTSA